MSKEEAKKNKTKFTETAKTRIKTGLILNEFGEQNKVQVSEQEIQAEVQKQLRMMPGQEKMVMDFYQKNPSAVASLRGTVYEEKIHTHPTMLFRYSAITFNGHRIHYDYPYSTQVEGYQDLIFHGPLQATLMLRASEKFKNTRAKSFSHKGIAPVYANENLHISIEQTQNGNVNCFTSTSSAGMTMMADAVF